MEPIWTGGGFRVLRTRLGLISVIESQNAAGPRETFRVTMYQNSHSDHQVPKMGTVRGLKQNTKGLPHAQSTDSRAKGVSVTYFWGSTGLDSEAIAAQGLRPCLTFWTGPAGQGLLWKHGNIWLVV